MSLTYSFLQTLTGSIQRAPAIAGNIVGFCLEAVFPVNSSICRAHRRLTMHRDNPRCSALCGCLVLHPPTVGDVLEVLIDPIMQVATQLLPCFFFFFC